MAKVYFTKKQKAQMRERRKRKRALQEQSKDDGSSQQRCDPSPSTDLPSKPEELEHDALNIPEKDRDDIHLEDSEGKCKKKKRKLTTQTVDGAIQVKIPRELSVKDAKKFRKETRRQLREEGVLDDKTTIEFFSSTDENPFPAKKKKKKQFPCIKELLEQRKELEQTLKEEDKQEKKIHGIPEEAKRQYIALDCEMVGIGADGKKSVLARVSIVDWDGAVLMDSFVKVPVRVTDFRTHVSGVEPKHIKENAMDVDKCRKEVAAILKGKILVGHALTNDFKALMLTHPKEMIRDTAKYRPFQRFGNGKWRPRKLRDLVKENLKGKEGFQEGEHDSVDDARGTMELFQLVRNGWEKDLISKTKRKH